MSCRGSREVASPIRHEFRQQLRPLRGRPSPSSRRNLLLPPLDSLWCSAASLASAAAASVRLGTTRTPTRPRRQRRTGSTALLAGRRLAGRAGRAARRRRHRRVRRPLDDGERRRVARPGRPGGHLHRAPELDRHPVEGWPPAGAATRQVVATRTHTPSTHNKGASALPWARGARSAHVRRWSSRKKIESTDRPTD